MYLVSSIVLMLHQPAIIILVSLMCLTLIDVVLLFVSKNPIQYDRKVPSMLYLGDSNFIELNIRNNTNQVLRVALYEGYPKEMQQRDKCIKLHFLPGKEKKWHYSFKPSKRGLIQFNNPIFSIQSMLHLCLRKHEVVASEQIAVYPSILQMKKYELLVFHQRKVKSGIKHIRRIGNNSEFEQIKDYVQGDEIRAINWKATSRSNKLMINKYQEEKSQQVYCVLDKSRTMQMEFDDMSLLDYSINSILVLSNVMLKNGDKIGLLTFSDKIGVELPAKKHLTQARLILENLYKQQSLFKDPNYELLYQTIRRKVKIRSMIVLFTNFETEASLNRAMPYIRKMNQKHVLLVVMFHNNDLKVQAQQTPNSIHGVYSSIISEQMSELKTKIASQLKQNGIQTILTLPEKLSLQTINKYLELKARGVI